MEAYYKEHVIKPVCGLRKGRLRGGRLGGVHESGSLLLLGNKPGSGGAALRLTFPSLISLALLCLQASPLTTLHYCQAEVQTSR